MKRTYTAEWSEEDQEFVGKCEGFPSLSWLAPTEGEALLGICNIINYESEDFPREKQMIAITEKQAEDIEACLSDFKSIIDNRLYHEYSSARLQKKLEDISKLEYLLTNKVKELK